MRVLVVDDDKYMADLVASLLKKRSVEVVSHSNLSDALRDLMDEDFDCIVVDLHLPGMDGLSAIPVIREINARIKIGLMTGDTDPQNRASALKQGADFFMQKPDDVLKIWEFLGEPAPAVQGRSGSPRAGKRKEGANV